MRKKRNKRKKETLDCHSVNTIRKSIQRNRDYSLKGMGAKDRNSFFPSACKRFLLFFLFFRHNNSDQHLKCITLLPFSSIFLLLSSSSSSIRFIIIPISFFHFSNFVIGTIIGVVCSFLCADRV